MATSTKDGIMVALAAAGLLTMILIAEFGLPALIVGASMSAASGALAVNRDAPAKDDLVEHDLTRRRPRRKHAA